MLHYPPITPGTPSCRVYNLAEMPALPPVCTRDKGMIQCAHTQAWPRATARTSRAWARLMEGHTMTTLSIHTPIGFIGAGAVGGTLAVALAQAGYRVTAIASRTWASAQGLAAGGGGWTAYATAQQVVSACDLVFISTPDDAIGAVASALTWRPGQGVVHCSGATSLEVFAQPCAQGALPGAL